MPENETPNENPVPETPSSDAATATTDWQSAYKGLQRKYNAQVTALREAQDEVQTLRGQVADLEQRLQEVTGGQERLNQDYQALQAEASTKEKELQEKVSRLEAQLALWETVATDEKYQALGPLAKVIPVDGSPEDMQRRLDELAQHVNQIVDRQVRSMSTGVVPTGNPQRSAGGPSLAELKKLAIEHAGTPDGQKYLEAWHAALEAQGDLEIPRP